MAGERSPLYSWMVERYDAYAEQMLARDFDWDKMVRRLGEEKITDRAGNPPTVKTAKATFLRLRTDRGDHKPRRRPVKVIQERRRSFQRSAG